MNFITYPAKPVDGGRFEKARRKFGAWAFEPKANGWRAELHLPTGLMWNRHGEALSIAVTFKQAHDHLRDALAGTGIDWLDVEAMDRRHAVMRGSLIVLDAIVPDATYLQRRAGLERLLWPFQPETGVGIGDNHAALIQTYPADKAAWLYAELQRQNDSLTPDWRRYKLNCFWEGIVGKEVNSHYPIQIRSASQMCGDWMKHRFV